MNGKTPCHQREGVDFKSHVALRTSVNAHPFSLTATCESNKLTFSGRGLMGGIKSPSFPHPPPASFWASIVLQLVALESLLVRSIAILQFHRLLQLLPIHHSPHSPLQQLPFLQPKAQKTLIRYSAGREPSHLKFSKLSQLPNLETTLCFASTPVPIKASGQNA